MAVDAFAVLAEPTRRRILDELRRSPRTVGDLVGTLAISQPSVSKHLKVLRDAGFVTSRIAAQTRVYRIEPAPLVTVDEWLAPYRELWPRHLDALERHLDQQAPDQQAPDQQAPDQQAPDQQALDQQAPDRQALDQQAPDRQELEE